MTENWNTDRDPFDTPDKAPALSFDQKPVGTTYTGVVDSTAKEVQARDFRTKELAFWPDGNPKKTVVINLTVDGEARSLWAPRPSAMFAALRDAQKAAGQRIAPGGKLTVRFTGEKPTENGFAQKLYAAKYEPPIAELSDPFADHASKSTADAVPPF